LSFSIFSIGIKRPAQNKERLKISFLARLKKDVILTFKNGTNIRFRGKITQDG